MVNTQVRIGNPRDLEAFANFIKEAIATRISLSEKFSGIRLQGTPLRINEFLHQSLRGVASETIEVRQTEGALQLAGTVLHEMGHVLVGPGQSHNENWHDACFALGLTRSEAGGQCYTEGDFSVATLRVIMEAIARFARDYPHLIYDPMMDIPLPEWIGLPDCPLRESGNGCPKHRIHVMQFQIDSVREMLSRSGNILLAHEMGLGKTPITCLYINATKPKRILIGCPNNAKLVWERHIRDWCVERYDVEVAGTRLYTFGDVVIMNYEAVVKWGASLSKQDWDLVISDEGHYLKTPNAKRSKAWYSIHGTKAIIITGTPIVNYPYELFPLIHYLDRQNWPEYGRFESMFGSRSRERLGRNLNRLNALLRATIMTRALKKDVLKELPKKRRVLVEFEVSDDIRKLIEEEKKLFNAAQGADLAATLNAIRNESDPMGDDVDWSALIEELKYTRRYAFEEMSRIAHLIGLAKLPLAIEHIENALEAREAVAVFGHHRDVLTAIAERFKPHSIIHMGNSAEPAAILAEQFNDNDQLTVFVGQYSIAQSYSLKKTSTVIFIEEDWVPGVMTQAEDRAHGIGRGDADAKSMLIQHLVFEDSLDTYKAKLTIRKQKSIDRAVGNLR